MKDAANSTKTVKRVIGRPFPKGVSGNPSGRPKGTLKDYVREKFIAMTPAEKDDFLKKIPPELRWRMGEGNPAQDTNNNIKGNLVIEISETIAKKRDVIAPDTGYGSE